LGLAPDSDVAVLQVGGSPESAANERGVLDTDALMRQAAAALDTVLPQTRSNGSAVLAPKKRRIGFPVSERAARYGSR